MQIFKTIVRPVAYPAIDGLRFYAAFCVFLEHAIGGAWTDYFQLPVADLNVHSPSILVRALYWLYDGTHGVDEFFVISGFLMARILTGSGRSFSYPRFVGSRIRRIYPAFLASMVIAVAGDCLVFGWPWRPLDVLGDLIFLNAIPGYPIIPYNLVTWSLGFEFAFYLVIPVLLLLMTVVDRRIAAIAAMTACHLFIPDGFIRMNALFAGAVIGAFDDDALRGVARLTPLWMIVPCYFATMALKPEIGFKTFYDWYLAAAGLLFIKIVWDQQNILHRFFTLHWMRWLGTLSYSVYLLHPMICSITLYFLTPRPASLYGFASYMVLSYLLVVAAAFVLYVLVEQRYFAGARRHHFQLQERSTG